MKIYVVVEKNKEVVQAFSSLSNANKFAEEVDIEATCYVVSLDGFFNVEKNARPKEGDIKP